MTAIFDERPAPNAPRPRTHRDGHSETRYFSKESRGGTVRPRTVEKSQLRPKTDNGQETRAKCCKIAPELTKTVVQTGFRLLPEPQPSPGAGRNGEPSPKRGGQSGRPGFRRINSEIRLLKNRHFEDVNRRLSGSGKGTPFDRDFSRTTRRKRTAPQDAPRRTQRHALFFEGTPRRNGPRHPHCRNISAPALENIAQKRIKVKKPGRNDAKVRQT